MDAHSHARKHTIPFFLSVRPLAPIRPRSCLASPARAATALLKPRRVEDDRRNYIFPPRRTSTIRPKVMGSSTTTVTQIVCVTTAISGTPRHVFPRQLGRCRTCVIHSFTHSLLIQSFIYPLSPPLIRSSPQSYSFVQSFIRPYIRPLIHSSTQ